MNDPSALSVTEPGIAISDQLLVGGRVNRAQRSLVRRLVSLAGLRSELSELAALLVLIATEEGSVCVDVDSVAREFAVDELEIDWPDADEWLAVVKADIAGGNSPNPLVVDGRRFYFDRYHRYETQFAVEVSRRRRGSRPLTAAQSDRVLLLNPEGDGIESQQARACRVALAGELTTIAGGPGTGKTTTIGRLVALLAQEVTEDQRPLRIALAAPTGRAAARLKESICEQAAAISAPDDVRAVMRSIQPTTLHRLLGWLPGNQSRFQHDRSNPLPYDAVIVDESSMISLAHMNQLCQALRPTSRLVLVGDPGQLASVDAGSAFGDIVATGFAPSTGGEIEHTVVLDRVFRFGDEIGALANAVLNGNADDVIALLEGADNTTLRWVAKSPEQMQPADQLAVISAAVDQWRTMTEAAAAGDRDESVRTASGARVLCGHRAGWHGVEYWNQLAFQALHPQQLARDAQDTWYVGRPILVNRNDYRLDVFNGDTGVVMDSTDGLRVVFDRSPEPLVVSPHRLGDIQTAYASTVHKAQGSQFDEVVVILPPPQSRLMTRELFYTAITRAKNKVTVVGDMEAVKTAVGNASVRQSGLRERLVALASAHPA